MSSETIVILAKHGTGRKEIKVKDLKIHDLWHIAQAIKDGSHKNLTPPDTDVIADQILEVWHLAHYLKEHINNEE